MEWTLLLLALMAISWLGVKADDAVFTSSEVDPASNSAVGVLETVKFTMTEDIQSIKEGAKAEVISRLQGTVATGTLSKDASNPKVLVVTISKPVVAKGSYQVYVPAGAMTSVSGKASEELSPVILVTGAAAPKNSFEASDVTPAPNDATGETIESLKTITLKFPAWVGGLDPDKKPTLALAADPENAMPVSIELGENEDEVIITIPTEISEPGTYLVHIPEATIFDNNFDESEPDFGVEYWGATYNPEYNLVYMVGKVFGLASVYPIPSEPVSSLKNITLFMTGNVGGFLTGATAKVMKDGEQVAEGTFDWALEPNSNEVEIRLDTELTEYGSYSVVIPAGVIFDENYDDLDPIMSGAKANDEIILVYQVGKFGISNITPDPSELVSSLQDITLFMSSRVGGILEGAKVRVMKNGEQVTEGVIDWATEPLGNDLLIHLDSEISEYGSYSVVIPAGVIFDENYDDLDPIMSGAKANDEIILVYQVGKFEVSIVTPDPSEPVKSLQDITLFMSSRVGGILEGAKAVVLKNGEQVTEGAIDWATEPLGNDLLIHLDSEISEYGSYSVVIPAGVIFDENYDEIDPIMSGAKANNEIILVYQVGEFDLVSVNPDPSVSVSSLNSITLFMSSRVGGFLEGATIKVTKDGEEVAEGTLDWATEPLGNDVLLMLDKTITERGVYTIEIPEGVIFDENYDELDPIMSGAKSNKTITLVYTVDYADGISGIGVSVDSNAKIYNLSGVRVTNADLKKGVYIINGKKVTIKK